MHKEEKVEYQWPEDEKAPGHKFLSEEILQQYAKERKRILAKPGETPAVTVTFLPRIP